MKIATFTDDAGDLLAMGETGKLVIYEKKGCHWEGIKTMPYSIEACNSTAQVRESVRKLAQYMEDCHTLLAKEVNGIYFTVLEGFRFDMWEMEGKAETYLNYIYDSEIMEKGKEKELKDYGPEKTGEDSYYINLEEVMENNDVTSKQVLMPFFEETAFSILEIDCAHMPRWFEKELENFHLEAQVKSTADGTKIWITKEGVNNEV